MVKSKKNSLEWGLLFFILFGCIGWFILFYGITTGIWINPTYLLPRFVVFSPWGAYIAVVFNGLVFITPLITLIWVIEFIRNLNK